MIRSRNLATIVALAGLLSAQVLPAFAAPIPQLVGGTDGVASNIPLKTDNVGRLLVVGSSGGGQAFGPDAQGAAPTQPPLFDGCIFLTSPTTVGNNQIVGARCDSKGFRFVVGAGVAGTQAGGVLTVQGDPAGTPIPVTGSFVGTSTIQGNSAASVADTGSPVKTGAKYLPAGSRPTYTTGNRTDTAADSRGNTYMALCGDNAVDCVSAILSGADGVSNTATGLLMYARPALWNGTTWDRAPGDTTGATVQGAKGAVTNGSGTITTGGTSQQAFAANATRKYLFCQNPSTASESLFFDFGTAASTTSGNSVEITAGGNFTFEGNFIPSGTVNVVGATTGDKFTCKQG